MLMARADKTIDGERIFDRLHRRIRRVVVLSEYEATVIVLWIALTHCFNEFRTCPRLGVTSPERGCGKTTLLLALNATVHKGLMTAHATAAAIFHEIASSAPTLLFDEADATFVSPELIAILNTGHQRDVAYVLRAAGTTGTQQYPTWVPAAYALLGKVPDTLASRSIKINMRRKTEEDNTRPLDSEMLDRLHRSRRRLATWCATNRKQLAKSRPATPGFLQNRDADNWQPLFAIAEIAGGRWPELALQAARSLQPRVQPAVGTELLSDIRDIMGTKGPKVFSSDLASELASREGRPWSNFEGRGRLSPASVAAILSPYGIVPKNIRDGARVLKGYRASQFDDAFARYLKPLKP
jgi:putative DNA primase/helicase